MNKDVFPLRTLRESLRPLRLILYRKGRKGGAKFAMKTSNLWQGAVYTLKIAGGVVKITAVFLVDSPFDPNRGTNDGAGQ